jgi:hypothetical protein
MGIATFLKSETFEVFFYGKTVVPNDIGEMPAPIKQNLHKKGMLYGRISPNDTVEPDILGAVKDYDVSAASMAIGIFDIPIGFVLETGDILISTTDDRRKFQVSFDDRYPGGINDHHIECRLQYTDEQERN